MLIDNRLRTANALTLQWHAGAATIDFEAFQAWCLALLKPRLRFDGAIWGVLTDTASTRGLRINSAHLHRVTGVAFEGFEQARASTLQAGKQAAGVVNMCVADAAWSAPEHAAAREHGRHHGMMNSLLARYATPDVSGEQFVLLSRKAVAHRFSSEEATQFEWLAPHMMQSFATCRRLFLDKAQAAGARQAGAAAAMIDRAGLVQDQNPRFIPTLRREWSDWPGHRLPDSLMDLATRRAGTRWRFMGMQVTADFVPVDDLYLVTARPRHVADALTLRETEVAQRYAAGGSFREIATALELRPATVRSHLRNVYGKLQIRNKSQLAAAMR